MLDIGFGEVIVIAVVALLVFGPDRLPKAAADAARTLRQVRQMASSARQELVAAAGIDEQDGDLKAAMADLRDLDPRRALASPRREPTRQPATRPPATRPPATRQPETRQPETRPAVSGPSTHSRNVSSQDVGVTNRAPVGPVPDAERVRESAPAGHGTAVGDSEPDGHTSPVGADPDWT